MLGLYDAIFYKPIFNLLIGTYNTIPGNDIGITIIYEHVKQVTDYLVEQLISVGAQILSSREEGEWSGIVSFEVPGRDAATAVEHCADRNVVISHRDGRLRASPHFYNNHDDIDRLIEALGKN